MTKIVQSKYKAGRRLGVSLWGNAKDPVIKKNYPPGQHGQLGRRRTTIYGVQLQAKQKLKKYYNISERQFRNICLKAKNVKGDSSENLIGLLERRLDAVVYRLNLAPTIFSARQLVSHKHVTVNGKSVNIPSFLVKPEDVVELKSSSKEMVMCIEATKKMDRAIPAYLSFDATTMKGSFIAVPKLADVPYAITMQPSVVLEFYSK
jgi:small subunit ribosomal protein S4